MKKSYLILAAAAIGLTFASCSGDEVAQEQSPQVTYEEGAVVFDAYVNRATTRAGQPGTLTSDNLKSLSEADKAQTGGFGVLGYYTNDEYYSVNSKPDFFYNQKVYYNGGWQYDPVKYWPNEFGSNAISQSQDRLTFFAYAPYVPVDTKTGIAKTTGSEDKLETGIIALTRNTAVGDPFVKYYASFDPEECVDLCFGVAKNNFVNSVDPSVPNEIVAGEPYVDVIKPTIDDKIYFDFKHALAQLNVQIDADVDEMSHGTQALDSKTKIYVREVTFEGLADKGMLNLNSEATSADYTPGWYDLTCINEIKSGKVTIYDGRRDGREGQVNAAASNEKPQNLNPTIIQTNEETEGVLGTDKKNLFDGAAASTPILVIPTDEALKVTIVYDVETEDENLATFLSDGKTHGSSVENKITKTIQLNSADLKLAAGKSYIVNMHLGMTSVKFDASVTDWVTPVIETDVDLPVNAPTFTYGTPATINLTSAEALTGQKFVITGLPSGTTGVTASAGSTVINGAPSVTVSGTNGIVTYATNANTTVLDRPENITFTPSPTASATTITFKQPAHALGLSCTGVGADGKTINIASTATGMAEGTWNGASIFTIERERNGAKTIFTKAAAAAAGTSFSVADGTNDYEGIITFVADDVFAAGDIYTITVKAGDAAQETITVKIGGIAYSPATTTLTYSKTADKYDAILPTLYGPGANVIGNYDTWAGTDGYLTVGTNGKITTVKVGTNKKITANLTSTYTSGATGWFFTTASKTSDLTVDIAAQAATIAFTTPAPADPAAFTSGNYAEGSQILDNPAILTGSIDGTLGQTGSTGGTVAYSVDDTHFQITEAGVLQFKGTWATGETHTVTVKAKVSGPSPANYTYAVDNVTYTITVQAAAE